MFEQDGRPERAVLLAVLAQGADEERELAEMRELLRTAQVDIAATCIQHRGSVHPRTYVGSGKLKELKELAAELDAEVIVTEDELSPSQ
jgi:GTPase